jgi:hypothetical protein
MLNRDDLSVYTRRTGESAKAFAAYCEYRDLGPERSITKVSQKYSKSIALLGRWSQKFGWVQRSAAYDAYLAEQERKAKEYARKKDAEKWVEREGEAREKTWQRAETLDKKLDGMLQFPLQTVEHTTETEVSPDGKTIINHVTKIMPARWSYRDVPKMAAVIDRLREESCRRNREIEAAQGRSGIVLGEDIEVIRR